MSLFKRAYIATANGEATAITVTIAMIICRPSGKDCSNGPREVSARHLLRLFSKLVRTCLYRLACVLVLVRESNSALHECKAQSLSGLVSSLPGVSYDLLATNC